MAKTANVFVRVNPEIKDEAEQVLNQLGISLSTAIEMYLRQIALQERIPFELTTKTDHNNVFVKSKKSNAKNLSIKEEMKF